MLNFRPVGSVPVPFGLASVLSFGGPRSAPWDVASFLLCWRLVGRGCMLERLARLGNRKLQIRRIRGAPERFSALKPIQLALGRARARGGCPLWVRVRRWAVGAARGADGLESISIGAKAMLRLSKVFQGPGVRAWPYVGAPKPF